LRTIADFAKDALHRFVDDNEFAFLYRLKQAESISEKIETGRFRSWSDINDLFACAIIVPTLADEPAVLRRLAELFVVQKISGRQSTSKDPNVFRFDCTRVSARIRSSLEQPGPAASIDFEIQIRTAFEHAWCVTTRELAFKGERIDWRFLRLAAQLKASVEQVDALIVGFGTFANSIQSQSWPEIDIKARVEELFKGSIECGKIPRELTPASWMRFCDSLFSAFRSAARELRRPVEQVASDALAILIEAVDKIEGAAMFPISLSLVQFSLGALMEAQFFPDRLPRYWAPVTDALQDIYPATMRLENVFDFQLRGEP
jgi:ppGpp synthetase/RelA/SpoT-type nucleotidyltranferase